MKYYAYFFTRQDLYDEYQLVQTAHVALELGNRLTPEQVKNLHFTCCGVDNLKELEMVEKNLTLLGHKFVTFVEEDIGNQKTAIGVFPIAEDERGILKNEKLLRFKRIV